MPHLRIQVELGFILQAGTSQFLNFAQNPRQSQSVQGRELNLGANFLNGGANRGGVGHRTSKQITSAVDGWLAENPRWIPSVAKTICGWNLPDSQLCLEFKTEPSVSKEGGGTPHIPY